MNVARTAFRLLCVLILISAIAQVVWVRPAHSAEPAGGDGVVKELENKRIALEERARALDEQEHRLQEREKELDQKIKKMERLRDVVTGELDAQKKNNEERVTKLVAVFETMSPKSAAAVFETLEDGLAVEALKRMDVKRVAKVMNLMEKTRSAKLSELLTGYVRPEAARKLSSVNTNDSNSTAGQVAAQTASSTPSSPQQQKSQMKGGEKLNANQSNKSR